MKLSSKWIILPLFLVVLAGCSAQTSTPTGTSTEEDVPNSAQQQETQGKMPASDMIVDVGMEDFKFNPTEIRAKAGSVITVRLVNNGDMTHDFVVDDLEVGSGILGKGDTKEITVVIPPAAKGKTFEYYCSVGNHRQMGMVGNLIVE